MAHGGIYAVNARSESTHLTKRALPARVVETSMPDSTTPRKLYAIMRYAKMKSFTALNRVCKHNTRILSGENIRQDAPAPVELLDQGSDDFVESASALLEELGIPRKSLDGKVLAVETVATASRGWFDKATDEEKQDWLRANVDWAKEKFGRGLLTAKLHLDEEVWHIHFVALPVVEKQDLPRGKKPKDPVKLAEYERRRAEAPMKWTMSYHDVLGGAKERFSREQDGYHAAVAHLGLERGEIQRDDVEIEIGDELTVSALELSRGHNPDGTPRPRRSMTPAKGRAAVKRLKREAEAVKRMADAARQRADAAEAIATAARVEAERQALEAADHLARAALRHDEANAATAAAERIRDALAVEHALAEEQRRALAADRRKLDEALFQAEQDRLALSQARDKAEAGAILAADERRAAGKEREALEAERQAVAQDKAALAERQKRQHDEIELLARGADDNNGLRLRPDQNAFVMTTEAMTDNERAVYRGRWTSGAIRIGHQLALALERIRRLAADLLRREGRVEAREAEIARREAIAAERDRRHAVAVADLERQQRAQESSREAALRLLAQRDQDLGRRAAALKEHEAAIQQRITVADRRITGIDRREAEHRAWMAVVTGAADGSLVGSFREEDGYFRIGRTAKAPTEAIARTIADRPPAWAADMFRLIDATFRDQANTAVRIMALNDEADDLQSAIAEARSWLPPEHQRSVEAASKTQEDVTTGLRRLAAMQAQERSR